MEREETINSVYKIVNRIVVPKVNEIIGDTTKNVKLMPIEVYNVEDVELENFDEREDYNHLRFIIQFKSNDSIYNVNYDFKFGLCDFIMNTCEYVLSYHPKPYRFIYDINYDDKKDQRIWYSDGDRDSNNDAFFKMSEPEFIFY